MFYSLHKQNTTALLPTANAQGQPSEGNLDKWPASYLDGFQAVHSNQWALEVGGLVEKPQQFSLKDFAQFTRIQQNRRLVFADGYSYRDTWEGFVVQELLHRLSPLPEAQYIKQTNLSGQIEYISLKDLYTQRALFCLRVRGKGLPAIHGGPLRLMVFDRYAHKGLGQLTKLELVAENSDETSVENRKGYFATKGYEPDALIQPGNYYACDLQRMETIHTPGEVLQW